MLKKSRFTWKKHNQERLFWGVTNRVASIYSSYNKQHYLEVLYQSFSNYAPRGQNRPRPGGHNFTLNYKSSCKNLLEP